MESGEKFRSQPPAPVEILLWLANIFFAPAVPLIGRKKLGALNSSAGARLPISAVVQVMIFLPSGKHRVAPCYSMFSFAHILAVLRARGLALFSPAMKRWAIVFRPSGLLRRVPAALDLRPPPGMLGEKTKRCAFAVQRQAFATV